MKIAIIGAGISGLYLAWKFSEKGHKVTVFEKKGEIGNEVCSGLFSQRILDFIPESQGLIQNKINFVLLRFPRKIVTVKFSKDFFVMSHFELDRLVASLSQKSGAEIILNSNISSMPGGFDPSPLAKGEGFDRVIGCDGANSFVRKSLSLPNPVFRLAIQGYIKKNSSENFVEVWPHNEGGFFWKVPRGQETEYGAIGKPQTVKKIFDSFLKKDNILLERIKSKIVPQGFIIPSNPIITLCGDATGLTKPWSGGGVIWGLTAAEILLKTFPDLLRYKKTMQRFFIPKIIFSKFATKTIYFLGFKMPWLLPKKTKIESDFLL